MQVPIGLVKYISLTRIDFIFRSHEICDPSLTWYILPLETHYLANPGKLGICSIWYVQCQQLTKMLYKKIDHVMSPALE